MNLLVTFYVLGTAYLTLGADSAATDVELRDAPEEFVRAAEDLKPEDLPNDGNDLGKEKTSKLSRLIRGALSSAASAYANDDEFRHDLEDLVRAANDAMPEDHPINENDVEEYFNQLSTLLRNRMDDKPLDERQAGVFDFFGKVVAKIKEYVGPIIKFAGKIVPALVGAVGE